MEKTLNDLLMEDPSEASDLSRIAIAAYLKGMATGRHLERCEIRESVEGVRPSRFKHLVSGVIEALFPEEKRKAIEGLKQEAEEIGNWAFDVPDEDDKRSDKERLDWIFEMRGVTPLQCKGYTLSDREDIDKAMDILPIDQINHLG